MEDMYTGKINISFNFVTDQPEKYCDSLLPYSGDIPMSGKAKYVYTN